MTVYRKRQGTSEKTKDEIFKKACTPEPLKDRFPCPECGKLMLKECKVCLQEKICINCERISCIGCKEQN